MPALTHENTQEQQAVVDEMRKEELGIPAVSGIDFSTFIYGEVSFTGILKASVQPQIMEIAEIIDSYGIPAKEFKLIPADGIHLTLVHQHIMKPYKHLFKDFNGLLPCRLEFHDSLWLRGDRERGRKSFALVIKNQGEIRKYVEDTFLKVCLAAGEKPPVFPVEPDRIFHISVANLTGSPADSVA